MIRLAYPAIEDDALESIREILSSGQLVQGKTVGEFESQIAQHVGAKFAIAVTNCTSALFLTLKALDIQSGDKVIVPAFSWPATANVVVLCDAEPVFVDIDQKTYNIDVKKLEETLSHFHDNRVKAIIPVHAFGLMAVMPPIMELAERYKVPVIEDAACALGAYGFGKYAGNFGLAGCFSFHPRKSITTGEGGMIVTNDSFLARRLKSLRNHGLDPDSPTPDFVEAGYNMRLTELQAALGVSQMKGLKNKLQIRRELSNHYHSLLKESALVIPELVEDREHIFQSYIVLLPPSIKEKRQHVINELKANNIEATIGTYHIPLTSYFKKQNDYKKGDFPNSDDVFERAVALPFHEKLSFAQQGEVAHRIKNILSDYDF
jgi:dTDP-4-amino-4,6-dideoxygalactose transaminase